MEVRDVLLDGFERVQEVVAAVLDEVDDRDLVRRPRAEGALPNTIAWLVWHLTRVQDDHLARAFDRDQVWRADGFAERFALRFDLADIGFGHGPDDVAAVVVSATDLRGYHRAVAERTAQLLSTLTPGDLDRVVDEGWDPPVTLGVRLVSVLADTLQHAGQAAYVRGLLGGDLGPTGAG